jgi:hypothetical protein
MRATTRDRSSPRNRVMWTPSVPTARVPPNPSRLLALGSRNSTSRFPSLQLIQGCSGASWRLRAPAPWPRKVRRRRVWRRFHPSFNVATRHSQVPSIVFKRQSFTCTRYGGCKRRGKARVQNSYVRIRVVVSERFRIRIAAVSRRAHAEPLPQRAHDAISPHL